MNSFLRWGVTIGLLAILFLPTVVSSTLFFPFITGKNFAFRIIVEIVLVLWLALALREPAYRPKKTLLIGLVTGLLIVLALATATAVDPQKAFWSNQERMEGLISFIHLFIYFVILTSTLKTERVWFWFWHTSIGVSVFVGLHGLLQLAGKAEIHQSSARLDASLGNASYLAVYMLVHIFLTAIYLRRQIKEGKATWAWFVYSPIIILQFVNLYYTATRGALLGFFGGALLVALLVSIFERQNKVVRRGALIVTSLMVLFLLFFISFKDSDLIKNNPVLGRFSEISFADGTVNARFLIWNMSWQGFKKHRILGWGPDNYMFLFNKYYDPKMYAQEQWFDRSHNVFFDWLISAGLLGLGLYLSLFITALYYLWKKIRDWGLLEKSLFTGLLAAYFFHNIFVFDQLISYLSFFSLLAYFNWHQGEKSPAIIESRLPPVFANSLTTLVVVVVAVSFYFVNIKPISASSNLIKAITPNQQSGYRESLPRFNQVLSANTFVSGEAIEQLASLAVTVVGDKQYDDNFKREFLTLAVNKLEARVKDQPTDARALLILGGLLRSTGNIEPALAVFKQAVAASPNKQTILFQLGQTYLTAGKIEEAIAIFKKAFELEPNFKEARKFYALSLFISGQIKESDKLLMEGFDTVIIDDDNFLNLYTQAKLYDRVEKIKAIRTGRTP